jgi:hypothetical protein
MISVKVMIVDDHDSDFVVSARAGKHRDHRGIGLDSYGPHAPYAPLLCAAFTVRAKQ